MPSVSPKRLPRGFPACSSSRSVRPRCVTNGSLAAHAGLGSNSPGAAALPVTATSDSGRSSSTSPFAGPVQRQEGHASGKDADVSGFPAHVLPPTSHRDFGYGFRRRQVDRHHMRLEVAFRELATGAEAHLNEPNTSPEISAAKLWNVVDSADRFCEGLSDPHPLNARLWRHFSPPSIGRYATRGSGGPTNGNSVYNQAIW